MTKKEKVSSGQEGWEIKDRHYYLTSKKTPLTYTIPSRHSERVPLLWFDEEKMEQRALRYATNQASPFVDEQKGEVTIRHIVFKDGFLHVPREHQALQKLLSLYHPDRDKRYKEMRPVEDAKDELVDLEIEILALNVAKEMEIDQAEAIMRVQNGTKVTTMTSKEIRRDLLLFAKSSPRQFIALAKDDNVQLRNFGIRAVEAGILKLSGDQRTVHWASNDRKLMTVPFDENPYSALAAWFKTDEGVEVYKTITKKLS